MAREYIISSTASRVQNSGRKRRATAHRMLKVDSGEEVLRRRCAV